jgi:serine/threonine-protein kinase
VIFGSTDHFVYCLDAESGAKRWSFKTGDIVPSPPLVSGGLVWVGSFDGTLYVLDVKTGNKLWSVKVPGGVYAGPAEAGGRVLVAGRNGSLICVQGSPVP